MTLYLAVSKRSFRVERPFSGSFSATNNAGLTLLPPVVEMGQVSN